MKTEQEKSPSELDTLAHSFERATGSFLTQAEQRLELARAMQDQEAIVREHIKMEVMKAARGLFRGSFKRACGRGAWDE